MSEQLLAPAEADSYAFSEISSAEVIPAMPSVGEQLRAAREAKNLSAADVAKALKLSTHQVMALEGDDWSRLPVTIIRGFIRNYARLLRIDPEPLMAELTALQMPQTPVLDLPEGSNTTLPQTGKAERRDYAAVFSGLALVVIALLAYFFVPQNFWQANLLALTSGGKQPAVAEKNTEPPAVNAVPVQIPKQDSVPGTAASAVPPETTVQPQPTQQSAAALPSSGLKLSFSQPSWVEIRDRSGQIIFSQLSPAGSQRDIEGLPPFALVIGNATNVTVQYKGKVVELLQRSKDDVARLNLD